VSQQQVRVAFLPVGESNIELLEPTDEDSGVARYLAKKGPGLHHICLEVDDLGETLQRLKEANVQLIDEEPRSGHDGVKLAFIHPKASGGTLVELYELPRDE
jgi:methylmalonyl-CoA/ethylmalonyl-CoA epimerase